MSKHETHEHEQKSKEHQPHAPHEEHTKGPSSETEINPKIPSDIAYWSEHFAVDGKKLHAVIESHGTHVAKIKAALEK